MEKSDLRILVQTYLSGRVIKTAIVEGIIKLVLLCVLLLGRVFITSWQPFPSRFYLKVKEMAKLQLRDGTGRSPHYSLRTLCRSLRYAAGDPCRNMTRSLYEVGTHVGSRHHSC